MIAITIFSNARQAAELWKHQYCYQGSWSILGDNTPSKVVYDKLISLGKNPSPEDVNNIIGNESWTKVICEECNKSTTESVLVGESTQICRNCLLEAIDLISRKENNE